MKTHILIPAALLLLCVGCQREAGTPLPYYRSAELTPEWLTEPEAQAPDLHRIADFALTNQAGETISQADVSGKIYVANFFFAQCATICPSLRSNMAAVQTAFADDDDVLILSHSVMPEADTVPVLAAYAQVNDVQLGKWHLLRGEQEAVATLADASYFSAFGLNTTFYHSENFVLVDPNGHIRGVYNGSLPLEVKQLINDIATLKQTLVGS
ncbi:MAG: SCO family protein [Bacteroidota bacterium]